jgi:lipoprotein-releasing system ATP-binding protein
VEDAAIRADGLVKKYASGAGELTVLDGLSLTVRRGERVALTGESGSGKSTLLHMLGGLDRPTAGAVWVEGREVTALAGDSLAEYRNQTLGFVWQVYSLLPEFTAEENVMMPLLMRGQTRALAAEAARGRLAETGLAGRATHRAGELSGGEQQRVALARALVAGPRVLLADEPTGNLDEGTGERMMDLLDEVHERHGLTLVFVTHNPRFAKRADRSLKLDRGVLLPYV